MRTSPRIRGYLPTVIILKTDDVVFAEISSSLNFYEY